MCDRWARHRLRRKGRRSYGLCSTVTVSRNIRHKLDTEVVGERRKHALPLFDERLLRSPCALLISSQVTLARQRLKMQERRGRPPKQSQIVLDLRPHVR